MRPEQRPALDADLNRLAGIVEDDFYRRGVWLFQSGGKKTVNRVAFRRMPVRVRPDDPVLAAAEETSEMLSRSLIRFRCCGHDCLLPPTCRSG